MNTYEYSKKIDFMGDYDVVVCGGGPAGIAAAVSAARLGVKVLLTERLGVLGGNLTVGEVCPILGSVAPGTISDEINALLNEGHEDARCDVTRNGREVGLVPSEAKRKLTQLVIDSGAQFTVLTDAVDVIKEGNCVKGVVLSTPGGLRAVSARVVVDATGDGRVAYEAGAEYEIGRELDRRVQPCSLEFTVDGVDESIAITAWGGSDPVKLPGTDREYRELCREKCREGELPENVAIVRLHRTLIAGERSVNATQYNGLDPLDPLSLAEAEADLRAQIGSVLEFLRKYVPGFENCREKSSASVPGVRESRRIMGDYILCDTDVETGAKKDDAVVHNAWFLIDIHNPSGGGQAEGFAKKAQPYDIPYGCLLPRGLEGILTAGRCISGTHRAHASYRVMTVCMAVGEAAGTAAALSVKANTTPRALGVSAVQTELTKKGVILK